MYTLILIFIETVYRNTWLGTLFFTNFRYFTNMLKKWSRGIDRAQYFNVNQIW